MAAQNAIRAGRAFVELFADNTKLIKGLRAAKKSLRSFGNDVTALGKQFAKATAVFATPFILGAKVFAEFQEQGAFVSTMLTNANRHMGTFNQALRDMSVQFGESTKTLSLGLFDILSAAIPAEKAIATLDASVRAARAGMVDTRTAADAITTILNSYSLSADNAADISDLLFTIIKRGKTTMVELAPVIGQVASIAASANVSLEEFGAALATMTRAGVRTENAVTSLRAIVSSFLKPTDDSAKAAKRLGFALSSTTLATEGLLGVFQRIQGLSPEQISKLFPNIRALKGVIPALKQMAGFTKDIGLMGKRAGATDVAFGKMTNTLKFEFNQAIQSGILVLSQLGESIEKPIRKALKAIKSVGQVTAAWVKDNRDLVVSIAKGVIAFGAASAALLALGSMFILSSFVVGALSNVLIAVGAAVGFVLVNIKLMAATVAVLTAQLIVVGSASIAFRGTLEKLASSGGKAIVGLGEKFKELKQAAVASFKGIADAMAAGDMKLATEILWTTIKVAWTKGIGFLTGKWLAFKQSFVEAGSNMAFAVIKVFDDVVFSIKSAFLKLINIVSDFRLTMALALAGLLGVFKSDEELSKEIALIEQADKDIRAKAKERFGDLESLEEAHQKRMNRILAAKLKLREKMIADELKLRQENAESVAAIEEDLAKSIATAKLKKDTEELRKKLAGIFKDAKKKATAFLKRFGFLGEPGTATAVLAGASDRAFQSSGTFNAQALAGLTSGDATSERIAKATELTASLIKKLKKKTFTP